MHLQMPAVELFADRLPKRLDEMNLKRSTAIFLMTLVLLSATAGWYGWERGKQPRQTAEEACKKQCYPLPWQIKGEKRIPNAPEGWRNYPTHPRCVCG
jgi:hypothetical protein